MQSTIKQCSYNKLLHHYIICTYVIFYCLQIRFESFTEPLLLLGCFDMNSKNFNSANLEPHDHSELSCTGSFTSFEAEFKSWKPPCDTLNEDSFVYCAAEIFRFLRDMALDIPFNQSTSLLEVRVS